MVVSRYAHIAAESAGLNVVSIATPWAPTLASTCSTPGSAQDVVVCDGLAYVADYDRGIQVMDFSDPGRPTVVRAYQTATPCKRVATYEGRVYALEESGATLLTIITS